MGMIGEQSGRAPSRRILGHLRCVGEEAAREMLWPTRCAICDAPGELLCRDCRSKLPFVDYWNACPVCGAPFGRVQCTECGPTALADFSLHVPPFDGFVSAVQYNDQVARLIRVWKDRGERRLAVEMARMMACVLPPPWRSEQGIVLPIPATEHALRRRGFDHGSDLARNLADELAFPLVQAYLPPKSFDQRALGRRERLKNMQTALSLRPGFVPSACALLVDDVCTTGATLYSAALLLREAGVGTIRCATFARTF